MIGNKRLCVVKVLLIVGFLKSLCQQVLNLNPSRTFRHTSKLYISTDK